MLAWGVTRMISPTVSIAIANHNGARFLEAAIASALAQDLSAIEVILVDDASTDDSMARAGAIASGDPRVRIARLHARRGPGAARNLALEMARGEWLAVLDADDLMHPARLARLMARARADDAQIIADDLLIFADDQRSRPRRFLRGARAAAPSWLTLEEMLAASRLFGRGPDLGYLKPVIRLADWRRSGVRYDETLGIVEDQDLLIRLLAAGLSCRIDPFLGYFYRRHAGSYSHRLSGEAVRTIADAEQRRRAAFAGRPELVPVIDQRLAAIANAQAFTAAIAALKARRPWQAGRIILSRPRAALLFRMPVTGVLKRLGRALAPPRRAAPRDEVWFISRQRLVGRANGSSAYLLDFAAGVRRAGLTPKLLQPSPDVLGRWPVLRLKREMAVFETIRHRGLIRVGRWVVARDPKVYAAAALGALAALLTRLGLPAAWLGATPAPFAPAAPWSSADRLYVARALRGRPVAVIADYAWQTEALAYALAPAARTAVIMHDLWHRRLALFGAPAGAPVIDRREELELLARAQTIIAIQKTEAEDIAELACGHELVVTPISAAAVPAPRPGDGQSVLFVGGNAASNSEAVDWMLEAVWPRIRAACPKATFLVAGSVCRGRRPPPAGVRYLGFVDNLDRLYEAAAVVVSPLISGSGLKIKLVEALAQGKACVVTPVTLQGVEEEAAAAVAVADRAEAFAEAVLRLLADRSARTAMGARALDVVRARFSAEVAGVAFDRWLQVCAGVRALGPPTPPAVARPEPALLARA